MGNMREDAERRVKAEQAERLRREKAYLAQVKSVKDAMSNNRRRKQREKVQEQYTSEIGRRLATKLDQQGVERLLEKARRELWNRKGKIEKKVVGDNAEISLTYSFSIPGKARKIQIFPARHYYYLSSDHYGHLTPAKYFEFYPISKASMYMKVAAWQTSDGSDYASLQVDNNPYAVGKENFRAISLDLPKDEFSAILTEQMIQHQVSALQQNNTPEDMRRRGREHMKGRVNFFRRLFTGNL